MDTIIIVLPNSLLAVYKKLLFFKIDFVSKHTAELLKALIIGGRL